jgi:hypothetical protein
MAGITAAHAQVTGNLGLQATIASAVSVKHKMVQQYKAALTMHTQAVCILATGTAQCIQPTVHKRLQVWRVRHLWLDYKKDVYKGITVDLGYL